MMRETMPTATDDQARRPHSKPAKGAINRHADRRRLRTLRYALALLGVVAASGCSGGEESDKPKPEREAVTVAVVPARTDGVQRRVEVVGTLFGQEDAIISNKVPGKVIAIYKDIGDRVAPGEPLAQLLKNDYQLSLNEKQSALQESLATLGLSDVPPDNFDLETVPAVRRASLQAENAKGKLERARQLHESKPPLISDQEFADLQTESQVAESAYQAALLDARSQVSIARTRKAQVAIAEQALRDTTIRAPRPMTDSTPDDASPPLVAPGTQPVADASGLAILLPPPSSPPTTSPGAVYAVAARYSSEGELNAGLTRMFRLVIDDPLKLKANVPERHAGEIKVGQRVAVRVEAERDAHPGTVTRINPQIDPTNRSFEVEVSVPNARHGLKPGAFARAEIETYLQPGVLMVPEKSVVSFAGVKKVYSVKDGKAVEVPIETGARVGGWVEVTKAKNLKAGEPVAVEGLNRLSSGVPVTVQKEHAATQPTPK
jgi:multidrug efflux pump subunit AcrA (membrane-fusion protein)